MVIDSGGLATCRFKSFVALPPALSVTCTVNVDVPALVGVPLMTPAAFSESPAGSEPDDTDHV